ncbi:MAG TPA: hypothetical protein PKY81_02285 [bacterium]|nr:hypothetical protein [bacterium]HPN29763.1 hypothetical protein [bacterium]
MIYKGYCFECEYEGKFKNKRFCPKCKSEDIEIYEDDEIEDEIEDDDFYDGEDENFYQDGNDENDDE